MFILRSANLICHAVQRLLLKYLPACHRKNYGMPGMGLFLEGYVVKLLVGGTFDALLLALILQYYL